MSRSHHITIEYDEQVLVEVKSILAQLITPDSQPELYREWASLGGERGHAVVWYEGPYDWPMLVYGGVDEATGLRIESGVFPKPVYVEPITPHALGLYPD